MADSYQLKAIISAVDRVSPILRRINSMTAGTRKHFADLGSATRNLANQIGLPIAAIAGLGAVTAIAGIQRAVSNFADLGDEVVKTSQRLGITTAEYQRLRYISGQSGVSVEGLSASVGRLNKNLGEAAAGKNANLAGLLHRAGISMRGANGEIRNATDLLPQIADLFARNTNAAVQARMGNALFGKSWAELAPLLQGGAAGVTELNERYKRLGLTLDHDVLKEGEAFGDQLADLKLVISSLGLRIGSQLVGPLTPLLDKLTMWAAANRDIIATKVSRFVIDLADSLEKIDWAGLKDGANGFISGLKTCVEWVGGTRNALIALAVLMNIQTIAAFVQLGGAAVKLGGYFIGLAATQIPLLMTSLRSMTAALVISNSVGAAPLLATLGKIAAVAGAGFVGWEIGSWISPWVNGKINSGVESMTGGENKTLGGWIYDKVNPSPLSPSQTKVGGEVKITFDGAPAGMRVDQTSANPSVPIKTDVGYRHGYTGGF
jgi:hypothetical protein